MSDLICSCCSGRGTQAGDFITDAVIPLDVNRTTGTRMLMAAGGVRPRRGRDLKGRCFMFADREQRPSILALGRFGLMALGPYPCRDGGRVRHIWACG
jgi:hypothetical protein